MQNSTATKGMESRQRKKVLLDLPVTNWIIVLHSRRKAFLASNMGDSIKSVSIGTDAELEP